MSKIVISDLFGTAFPSSISKCDQLYGKSMERNDIDSIIANKEYHTYLLDKAAEQFMFTVNEYLNNGNHLFIVSNLATHDTSADFILDEIINRFRKYNEFNVYLVTQGGSADFNIEDLEPKISSKFIENGIQYIIYDGYKVGLLNDKTEIFGIIADKFNLEENELYCTGNMPDDMPMLFKCIENGGKSTLLNAGLYSSNDFNDETLHQLIHKKACNEYKIFCERQILADYPNYFELDEELKMEIKKKCMHLSSKKARERYLQWTKKRIPELYEELRNGKFSKDDLIKSNFVFSYHLIFTHNFVDKDMCCLYPWEEITMASTFRDYYNNFLSDEKSNNGYTLIKKGNS